MFWVSLNKGKFLLKPQKHLWFQQKHKTTKMTNIGQKLNQYLVPRLGQFKTHFLACFVCINLIFLEDQFSVEKQQKLDQILTQKKVTLGPDIDSTDTKNHNHKSNRNK